MRRRAGGYGPVAGRRRALFPIHNKFYMVVAYFGAAGALRIAHPAVLGSVLRWWRSGRRAHCAAVGPILRTRDQGLEQSSRYLAAPAPSRTSSIRCSISSTHSAGVASLNTAGRRPWV